MPFKVKTQESEVEPVSKTRATMVKELKELKPVQGPVVGVIGEIKAKSMPSQEILNQAEAEEKQKLIKLISKYVEPPTLSQSKPNPARDRVSFDRKLHKQTLGELKRFWPGEIPEGLKLTDEEITDLNERFEDISP